jgi:type IV secretion system protein VirD4
VSRGPRSQPSHNGAGAGVFLAVVSAVVGGGSLLVWIAGAIGGVAAGHGPVLVSLSDAGAVLAELPSHLDDPARAWPAPVRGELPDRTPMLASLVVTLGLLVALAVTALWLVGRVRGVGGAKARRAARWAAARDLRQLRVKGPRRGRVILGRYQRQLVASEPRTSVLVVAPTQSGKTTSLVVPAILEWDGPVLATSIKADLVQDTLAARSRRGETKLFDPTNSTGLPTAPWSPIAASTSWSAARRTAAGILLIREKDAFAASVDDRHWKPAAARLLAPVLLAAAHSSRPMGDVLRWLARLEAESTVDKIADVLATCGADGADVALDVLLGLQDRDSRYRSSVIATLETALDPWLEPSVARATGIAGGIDPQWLLDGSNTLYLSAPAYDQHRLSGLFTALINAVVEAAFARSSRTGQPIDPPLLLCLDEAANVAPLPNLGEIASTAAGQGVQVLSVFQNLSQISERWGRDRAETVMANHVARLFGSGIADRATLDYLGAVLGEEEIEKVSTHRQRLELNLGSRTYSKDFKRLAAPDRVRQAERDTALLVYGNIAPAWISLRPWYRDRALRAQVTAACAPAPAVEPSVVEDVVAEDVT